MIKKELKIKNSKKICKNFLKNFSRLKHKKIVLYGIGPETEILVNGLKEFNIIGLMDQNKRFQNKFFYKKKILSEESVIKANPIIIIVSKPEKVDIIFSSIEHLQNKNKLEIFFKNGKRILDEKKNNLVSSSLKFPNLEKLKKEILRNDIITFDIFDTLVVRNVIDPHDIFSIVEKNINKKIKKKINFSLERIIAENKCYNEFSHNFSLNEVYEKIQKKIKVSAKGLDLIKKEEIETEIRYSSPRNELVKIFDFAVKNKKKVSLITDMYLDYKVIKKILNKSNIKGYRNLLISSELKKNKIHGDIFEFFKSIEPGKKYLHIGDNYKSDILSAKKKGFKTFLILNKKEIYTNSSLKSLKNNISNEFDLTSLGLLSNKIFVKDRFNFFDKTNMPIINNYEDLGYIIFGPLLYYYTVWLNQNIKKLHIKKILFCAREGYFMIQLFKLLRKNYKIEDHCKTIYFKTSRRMAVIPTLKNFSDILASFKNHRFYGNLKTLLTIRLGVKIEVDKKLNKLVLNNQENPSQFRKFLLKYKNLILDNAKNEKKNYKKYLIKIIKKKERIIICDQGFNGSVQSALEKILNIRFYGIYMSIKKKLSKIDRSTKLGFYNYNGNFRNLNHIFESVFTAPHGAYIKFDGKKNFFLGKKMSNQKFFNTKRKIFSGVKTYFNDMAKLELDIDNIDIKNNFPDEIFGLMKQNKILIDQKILKSFYFDNSYVREGENKISF